MQRVAYLYQYSDIRRSKRKKNIYIYPGCGCASLINTVAALTCLLRSKITDCALMAWLKGYIQDEDCVRHVKL